MAALMGGIAAHEAIKIVTAQFVPANNTFIFNAITGASTTVEM